VRIYAVLLFKVIRVQKTHAWGMHEFFLGESNTSIFRSISHVFPRFQRRGYFLLRQISWFDQGKMLERIAYRLGLA